jgi:hypothetical protein
MMVLNNKKMVGDVVVVLKTNFFKDLPKTIKEFEIEQLPFFN